LLANVEPAEVVEAVRAGEGGGDGVADAVDQAVGAAADQGDRGADDAGGAVVLLAVAIRVDPETVAQAGELDQTGVPGEVVLAGHQGGDDGQAGGWVGVAVDAVTALVLLDEGVAGRLDELDLVVAGTRSLNSSSRGCRRCWRWWWWRPRCRRPCTG